LVSGDGESAVQRLGRLDSESVVVYYFYGDGCPHCAEVDPFIGELERSGVNVERFEVYGDRGNLELLNEYFDRFDAPLNDRGIPAVFVGDFYLVGDREILDGLGRFVLDSAKADAEPVQVISEGDEACNVREESEVFDCLSMLSITVAALVDSINPCSMAILFFLLAGLLLLRKRRKALKVGLAFTLSVFIANLLFGFGILSTIVFSGLSDVLKVTAGSIAILTGILLLKDAFYYGAGGFKMEVPESLRPYLKRRLSKAFFGKNSGPLAAFLAGLLVSIFEVPCTGGPYFYVLARMADSTTGMQTTPILLYYNLIFVLPLVLITVLLYFGSVHVERAREWKERNKRLIDFIRGLPMIAVGLITIPAAQMSQGVGLFLNVYRVVGIPLLAVFSSYLVYQYLSKRENRSKMVKWTCIVALTAMTVLAAIIGAQTLNIKQAEQKSATASALEPCPDPENVTECCIMDQQTAYYITSDINANGDCFIVPGPIAATSVNCQGHTITGNGDGIAFNISNRDNFIMAYCRITNFTVGVNIEPGSDVAVIEKNEIYDNDEAILFNANPDLPPSYRSTIRNNIIIDNFFGIHIRRSKENKIYNNYFADNYYNAYDDTGYENYWNITKTLEKNIIGGPYKGGNYWDDYIGLDTDGDGIGDTNLPYDHNNWILMGGDYHPLTDNQAPKYSNATASQVTQAPYIYTLNITWIDNAAIEKVILELDGTNITDITKLEEAIGFTSDYRQVEHEIVYSKTLFNLSLGTHYYKWYAKDAAGNWNSTNLLTLNITDSVHIRTEISPILEITANITTQETSNITEAIEQVQLHFKIDDNWFTIPMSYNQAAGLYSALIPTYNQLANKTIEYYVVAKDNFGNLIVSEPQTYTTPDWIRADINRDGKVDIYDIAYAARNFGRPP
jgi:parallel beta-helix repeat protein